MDSSRRYMTAMCLPKQQQRRTARRNTAAPAPSEPLQQQAVQTAEPAGLHRTRLGETHQATAAAQPQQHTASSAQLLMAEIHAKQKFRALIRQFVTFHKDQPPNTWQRITPLDANHPFIGMANTDHGDGGNLQLRLTLVQTSHEYIQLPDEL